MKKKNTEDNSKSKHPRKKRGCLIAILVVVVLFVGIGVLGSIVDPVPQSSNQQKEAKIETKEKKDKNKTQMPVGKTENEEEKVDNKDKTVGSDKKKKNDNGSDDSKVKETQKNDDTKTPETKFGYSSDVYSDIEPNTSDMVDSIARNAKAAANHSASEDNRDYCLNFIKEKYPDYFTDNATMEETMYCGYYLEYAYRDNGTENLYANLGMDVYQAVKYFYRGTESVEDDHVQENLKQIKEGLNKIGIEVSSDNAEAVAPIVETDTSQQETVEKMVWIPESGSKYHNKSSCSGMNNPQQVTLSEAESLGFTPCKKCH